MEVSSGVAGGLDTASIHPRAEVGDFHLSVTPIQQL